MSDQTQQPLSAQEVMQQQAHVLLQIGDLSMQLEQKQAEHDAIRNRLLSARLELSRLTGYALGLAHGSAQPQTPEQPDEPQTLQAPRTGRKAQA